MADNQSQRGQRYRGRGRSKSRAGQRQNRQASIPPPINYGNPDLIKEQVEEKAKIEARIAQNEQLAKAAELKPKPANKDKIIEEGKQLANKFFNGFNLETPGNIKVTLDSSFVNRIAQPYYTKVDQVVRDEFPSDDSNDLEEHQKELCSKLVGAFDLATAAKLYKSAPKSEQDRMYYYNSIHQAEIVLPKKAGVIINQLGKTDFKDNDKIRIIGQDLVAKRHLIRGLVHSAGRKVFEPYMSSGKYNDLKKNITKASLFDGMIDKTSSSVIYIHERIQQLFDDIRSKAITAIDQNGSLCVFSFPPYNFKEATPATLKSYCENPLFKMFAYKDNKDIYKIAATTALSLINISWLRNKDKTIGVLLDKDKTNTDIDQITVNELFTWLNFWDINDFIEERDINELTIDMIHDWNSNHSARLINHINMGIINFSSFGSESQIVQVDDSHVTKFNSDFKPHEQAYHGLTLNYIKGKAKSWVHTKLSDVGAVFGSMVKFSSKVEYEAKFDINLSNSNRDMLNEFIRSDFK